MPYLMRRRERSIRNSLAAAIGLTLSGITCAVYGSNLVGGVATIAGLFLLGLSVHRLGRLGSDT
jgi:hypothetical protein